MRLVTRLVAGLARIGVKPRAIKVAVLGAVTRTVLRRCVLRWPACGAVMVPINFMLKADEVAYILRHAGAEDAGHRQWPGRAGAGKPRKLDTQVQTVHVWLPSEDIEPTRGGHAQL